MKFNLEQKSIQNEEYPPKFCSEPQNLKLHTLSNTISTIYKDFDDIRSRGRNRVVINSLNTSNS